jgi:hypothetical protein
MYRVDDRPNSTATTEDEYLEIFGSYTAELRDAVLNKTAIMVNGKPKLPPKETDDATNTAEAASSTVSEAAGSASAAGSATGGTPTERTTAAEKGAVVANRGSSAKTKSDQQR